MSTTTVTGTINGVNNTALANKWITFRLVQLGTDSGATATVAQSVDSVQTDANGDFSIDVWNNGDSGKESVLEITVDGSRAESVIIPTGTVSIELWDLIENYQADGSTSEQVPVESALFVRKSNNLSDLGSDSTSRANLGVAIGTDVQAHSATLDATTASFTTADESKLDGIEASADVTDATNIAASGGYVAGGTDVALTDGGTGASDAPTARTNLSVPSIAEAVLVANNLSELTPTSATARTNLGVAIGSNVQAHSAILDATTASFTTADETKLGDIEALADVTDSTNILAAGGYITGTTVVPIADGGTGATTAAAARAALGVPATSEGLSAVNNLSDVADAATSRNNLQLGSVSTTDITNYATAAQGTLADNAIPTSEIGFSVQGYNAFLDATTASFTSAEETKLTNIEDNADVTNSVNIAAAGGYVQGGTAVAVIDGGTGANTASTARTNLGLLIGTDVQAQSSILQATTASFTGAQETKLTNIEDNADVTDAINIAAAGGYVQGGADVSVADGGTGASTDLDAVRNLGFPYNAIGGTTSTSSANYFVQSTDRTILVDDTAAGQIANVNLISTAIGDGFEVIVKKIGNSYPVSVIPSGIDQPIDGAAELTLLSQDDTVHIISDGGEWRVVSQYSKTPSPTKTITAASYNLVTSDNVIFVNNFGISNVLITLLSAATVENGFQLDIKKIGASSVDTLQDNVIVYANGTETIDGNSSIIITDQNQAIRLISDGSNWKILSPHNITGWAIYDDEASHITPITVNNTRHPISIDNLGTSSNQDYLPSGVTQFWDTTNNKITPAKLGDAYDIRIDFEAQAAGGASSYANLILDVGDGVSIPIVNRNISFQGTTLSSFSIGFPIASMDDFMLNGGKIYFDTSISGDNITLSNVVLFIKRDFSTL